jgi:catechol 2,3-dioxygenase-like lactoylglutathione lyase family enzyme
MIKIANAQLWVHDQEEALAFWTEKVGMEVQSDVTLPEMGDFRWLTVGPPGQADVSIVLMAIPGPPAFWWQWTAITFFPDFSAFLASGRSGNCW